MIVNIGSAATAFSTPVLMLLTPRVRSSSLSGCHAQKSSGIEIAATGKVLTFTDMDQCEVNLQLGRILPARI